MNYLTDQQPIVYSNRASAGVRDPISLAFSFSPLVLLWGHGLPLTKNAKILLQKDLN